MWKINDKVRVLRKQLTTNQFVEIDKGIIVGVGCSRAGEPIFVQFWGKDDSEIWHEWLPLNSPNLKIVHV